MRLFKRGDTETRIEPGCPVFTADNETLGYVKEAGGETFLVEVPLGRDFWLGINHVSSASDSLLVLDFTEEFAQFVAADRLTHRFVRRRPELREALGGGWGLV